MRRKMTAAVMAMAALTALPVQAQMQVDGAAARDQLFPLRGIELELIRVPSLTETDLQIVGEVARQQVYYASLAFSPDEGLMSAATVSATNYHNTDASDAAALAACNARKAEGTASCQLVARVKPLDWSPRPIQLSFAATEAFLGYGRLRGEKALAASARSVSFAMTSGPGAAAAAVAECNRKAAAEGAPDCQVVIRD